MREYSATLHGYKIVKPARCKLERLEPATESITLPLHFAESAPVAMRVSGPLEYVGKDGNTYTWRRDGVELFALDGMLWKRYDTAGWHDGPFTIEELASQCVKRHYNENYLERWPWQWRTMDAPPAGLLVRDHGTWATLENLQTHILQNCDAFAVIDGQLYEPAKELVYCYDRTDGFGWPPREESAGCVIVAREYDPIDSCKRHLCNALQDWREVNVFDEYAHRLQDKLVNEVTGADVIEVLLPEYVKADPYADFWREEIRRHEEKAANCKQAAKEHAEKARQLREDAKRDREAAGRELETAEKINEKLQAYLNNAKEA